MFTRFVRAQLIIFTVVSVIGICAMVLVYMQMPTLLGIGRMTVKLELPRSGGLYRFANVTYRGVQLGKVVDIEATEAGAEATLSLATSPKVPADLQARVLSVSAVGEQYVDLRPRTDSGPFLKDGSVIDVRNTTVPPKVGPLLKQTSALLESIPKEKLSQLLDESFRGFNGAGTDLSNLLESSSTLVRDFDGAADQAKALFEDSHPLLDGQATTADAIRNWARGLAGLTAQLRSNDPQIRELLRNGPGAADQASRLIDQVKPTLPVLLANLTTIGQIAVVYHASIEQLLVLLPPDVAQTQAIGLSTKNPTGMAQGDFTLTISDPPACSVGFLPPSSWRSPDDLTEIDTPDGLYCKLPQDSPVAVRGARNYPCMGQPGKRAPTVEICESAQPFEPLAMRDHALGPSPVDPNLLAQGIPPDDRVTANDHIYGPLEGTPMPPGPAQVVAPSGFSGSSGPSVAVATYNPDSGQFSAPGGGVYLKPDVVVKAGERSWQDLLPTS